MCWKTIELVGCGGDTTDTDNIAGQCKVWNSDSNHETVVGP